MMTFWLVTVLLLSGATLSRQTQSGLSCVNDYVTSVICEWKNTTQDCELCGIRKTYKGMITKCCKLESVHSQSNTSSCSFNFGSMGFSFKDRIEVKVVCNGSAVNTLQKYNPGHHIKMHPPGKPNITRGNITWNRGSRYSSLIENYEFELQLKTEQQRWEDVSPRRVKGSFVVLDSGSLELGQQFQVRVRVKPEESSNGGQLQGQWSEWSPAVSWKADIGRNRTIIKDEEIVNLTSGILICIGGLIFLPLGLLTICIVQRHKCRLVAVCEHVPDPSNYFQPLLSVHNGNFQKWLGPQHVAHSFLAPQSCDCDISPVEVSEPLDDDLVTISSLFQTNPMASYQQNSSNSESTSGFSNMGYFYSEHQPGSLCLETCPVYFTYQPEGVNNGHLQSATSYERLQGQDQEPQQEEPLSPDSGCGMGGEEVEDEEEQEEEIEKGMKEECSGVNVQHLVSFVLALQESSRMTSGAVHVPASFDLSPDFFPLPEDAEDPGISDTPEPPGAAVVRPSSMVVQPCSSGYLTLKEMQKYSNKSI